MEAKKTYTNDEIKKIAPGYQRKPENFDPERARKGKAKASPSKPKQERSAGPSTADVVAPTHMGLPQKPTAQRNGKFVTDAIFGPDAKIFPIEPRETFAISNANLPLLAKEVYQSYVPAEKQLDRLLAEEEMTYYATGLMWLRLLSVKAKQGRQAMTSAEKDIRKETQGDQFTVPQPLYIYLSQMGEIVDAGGKTTELEIPPLPVAQAGGLGGYHAAAIDQDTHNLFEEVPCLGITADAVMALQSPNLQANYRVGFPVGARLTNNLCGSVPMIAAPRDEIKRRLTGQGITANVFPEFATNTRMNVRYMRQISDIISKFDMFRNEKVVIDNITNDGGDVQIVQTHPPDQGQRCDPWTRISVEPRSANLVEVAAIAAAVSFGFQTYKEPGHGETLTARSQSWSCLDASPQTEVQ